MLQRKHERSLICVDFLMTQAWNTRWWTRRQSRDKFTELSRQKRKTHLNYNFPWHIRSIWRPLRGLVCSLTYEKSFFKNETLQLTSHQDTFELQAPKISSFVCVVGEKRLYDAKEICYELFLNAFCPFKHSRRKQNSLDFSTYSRMNLLSKNELD